VAVPQTDEYAYCLSCVCPDSGNRPFLHVLLNPWGGFLGGGKATSHVWLSEGLRRGRSGANGGGCGFITGKYHHDDGDDGHFLCARCSSSSSGGGSGML